MDRELCDIEKKNMKLSLWIWTALCAVLMAVMLIFAAGKTVVIADSSQNEAGFSSDSSLMGHSGQEIGLALEEQPGMDGSFRIPLPQGIKPEDVTMENRYMNSQLWIRIQGGEQDFYRDNGICGDVSHILESCCEMREDGILLKFLLDDVMEYRSTLEGNMLSIAYSRPHDLYDFLVVLDPAGGGSETGAAGEELKEKDLALDVARLVQRQFDLQNVRLYLTRTEDVDVAAADRAAFAEAVGADLYIRIGARTDPDDPDAYGILGGYNDTYFIPDYGNEKLADAVTRQVTIASSNRAVGLEPVSEDSILRQIRTTAAELSVGYLSNPKEEALLCRTAYREKLAAGIVEAVKEACGTMEQYREDDAGESDGGD